jgi:hypothetical protein
MSDDDLENDDLEVGDDDETEEGLEAAAEDVAEDDGGDAPVPTAKGKAKAAVSVDELPSVEAKNKERDALARAMEEFLAKGSGTGRQGAGSGGQCGRRSAQEAGQQVRQPAYLSLLPAY